MRRRIAFVIGVSAALVAVVVTAAWFFFVAQTRQAIGQWAETQRRNGIDVSWQSLEFSGFPLRVDAHIGDPRLTVRRPDSLATWKPSFLTFKFSSVTPRAVDFASPGNHALHFTNGAASWSALVETESLDGEAIFPPDNSARIEQITSRFAGVRITPQAWTAPITLQRATFDAFRRAPPPPDPQDVHPRGVSLKLDLATQDVGLPEDVVDAGVLASLGPRITAFSTDIEVMGDLDSRSLDASALAAWRDGGGTVEVTSLELHWGSLRLSAGGTMALDGNLQPVGSFAARIAGLEEFITALETDGFLSRNDAAVARITLAVLTRASDDGGPPRVQIPVTLQERVLRLGPVALFEVPPIVWE